jgi:hypothetical protein
LIDLPFKKNKAIRVLLTDVVYKYVNTRKIDPQPKKKLKTVAQKLEIIRALESSCRRCRPGVGRNVYRRYFSRKGYRFEISATLYHLGLIDAPHIQNFVNLKSLEKTQESKKFKVLISFLKC